MDRSYLLTKLSQKFKVNRIVALLGPRQCGKTTLAQNYAQQTPDFQRQNYFDLEKPTDLDRLNAPYFALNELNGLIIIDEIQRRPDLFPILRVLHDERPDLRFLVLGSASKHLLQQSSETLTGRIHYEEITPFSSWETREWKQLWFRGGFPVSFLAESDEISAEWRHNYIKTLLEQDVPNLGFRIPALQLRKFWVLLAHTHGQLFNAHQLARDIELSAPSMRRYLELLHDMMMVRVLQPYYSNAKKREVKTPKVYIRDSGLFHNLVDITTRERFVLFPKRGASFEGFIIEEVIRLLSVGPENCFFWRTQTGDELDLLVFAKHKKLAFEVKLADSPQLTKSMHQSRSELEYDHLYVVYPGDITWKINEWATALSCNDLHRLGEIAFYPDVL